MKLLLITLSIACFIYAAELRGPDTRVADAAQARDVTQLRALIRQHAAVNTPQADGTTALEWAAHWNDADAVDLLIAAGADAKAGNRYGATPLSEAANLGN